MGIDFEQKFETLPRPPIVEAMILINGRAEADWTFEKVGKALQQAMPEYPQGQSLNATRVQIAIQPPTPSTIGTVPAAGGPPVNPATTAQDLGWAGLRLISADGRQVVSLTRDSFVLSRLAPYEGWRSLSNEALRLWSTYAHIGEVRAVNDIHVRFINRLEVPEADFDPSRYFQGFGTPPHGMVLGPFLHQDTLFLAQTPKYLVSLVRTFDPNNPPTAGGVPLILDLEALCGEPFPAEGDTIKRRLTEMHWLKNHAFFASVTRDFLDLCR